MSVNGALFEDKMRRFKSECAHFSFKKCPIYTHDGANAKFSTNSHEMNYSVGFGLWAINGRILTDSSKSFTASDRLIQMDSDGFLNLLCLLPLMDGFGQVPGQDILTNDCRTLLPASHPL